VKVSGNIFASFNLKGENVQTLKEFCPKVWILNRKSMWHASRFTHDLGSMLPGQKGKTVLTRNFIGQSPMIPTMSLISHGDGGMLEVPYTY
jgi:hypothetical protein